MTAYARVNKGTPAGGQFAAKARPAGTITLVPTDDIDLDRVVEYAHASARYWSGHLGINDPDEVEGRAIMAVLTQRRPNGVRNLRGYVHALAGGAAMDYMSNHSRVIRRARVALAAEQEAWVQCNKTWPSAAKQAEIAATVRSRFAPGRRPPHDYAQRAVLSLVPNDEGDPVSGTPMWAQSPDADADDSLDASFDHVESVLASAPRRAPAKARTGLAGDAWGMLVPDGPGIAAQPSATAKAARAQIARSGGVVATLGLLATGEADDETFDAFFSPFKISCEAERQRVVMVLRRHRTYAEAIWAGALGASVKLGANAS